MKPSSIILGIKSPKKSVDYYTNHLGMELVNKFANEGKENYVLRFPDGGNSISLELSCDKKYENSNEFYQESPDDNYWKYSLFVDDIERVFESLDGEYLNGKPYQFKDIGYLLHTKDADNYNIEFIQKHFKQNTQSAPKIESLPLKESPVFGLITLRTKDPLKTINFYQNLFGLKFFVRMYVERGNGMGFTLYFLGPKHLTPPNLLNPDAIENREWMYQQRETFIELQYHWGVEHKKDFQLVDKSEKVFGLKGICFDSNDLAEVSHQLKTLGATFDEKFNTLYDKNTLLLKSPDNHQILIKQRD